MTGSTPGDRSIIAAPNSYPFNLTYTRNKQGQVIAAHFASRAHGNRRRAVLHAPRKSQGQTPAQRMAALFA